MPDKPKADRLHQHMAHMMTLEGEAEAALEQLLDSNHAGTAAMAAEFHGLIKGQGQALAARLETIAGGGIVDAEFEDPLRHAHLAVLKALMGYARMQVLARRFAHGTPTPQGETDDLGQRNAQNHAEALHAMNKLLHDAVLWELDQEGLSCQCPCPCCSHGICLCAVSSRSVQGNAWCEGGVPAEVGVVVHSPPKDSAAGKAGLRHGDTVVTADGQDIDAFGTLQAVVREHQSGEAIELQVRRADGRIDDVTVVRN